MNHLGLIGYPLDHSLSPKIHQAALEACALPGDYSLFPIHPDTPHDIKNLLLRVRAEEISGLNVTIPYKETVIPLLDQLTPTAEAIGAVNTIFLDKGKLTGENTDAAGFISDLHHQFHQFKFNPKSDHNALILGAGGSARAVTYALLKDGWRVTLSARRSNQSMNLIAQYPSHSNRLSVCQLNSPALQAQTESLDLIVNTTPVGMSPNIEVSPWPTGLPFPQAAFVYDLVYNPRKTKLTLESQSASLPAATGLGMLVEQAALAFKIWTGKDVSRSILLKSLEEK
ncbi:shikimate dehydrogenase [bacterium]|nr:shikimate dehydrogenase [bacterium]